MILVSIIVALDVTPGISFLVSRLYPRTVFILSLGAMGLGLFGYLFLFLIYELIQAGYISVLPLFHPYLTCIGGPLVIFMGMASLIGFAVRKLSQKAE